MWFDLVGSRARRSAGTLTVGMSVLSLVALSACSSTSPDDPVRHRSLVLLRSDVARAPANDSADLGDAARGLRDLGHALATHLPADAGKNGNQVFSPASLAIAFAMLREGAGPAAAAEIDKVIGLPANRQSAYNRITHALTDVGAGDTLEINDALFLDPGYAVKRRYLDAIATWYGAGVQQTRFPSPALDDINRWVELKTHGRIPRLLDQLDPAAVFALVNTIYLKAAWAKPFPAPDTIDAPFTTGSGDDVTVKTMNQQSELDLATGPGWKAVRLPYAGGRLSMWVLLPTAETGDPRELLTSTVLADAAQRARPETVQLALPRWNTETHADLVDVLQQLGMRDTFGLNQYPGIVDDPTFGISDVVQQANITVGEKGTEAAAATVIVGETSGQVPSGVPFLADHPFAFAIVQDETGVPLFEGVVRDPSAGGQVS